MFLGYREWSIEWSNFLLFFSKPPFLDIHFFIKKINIFTFGGWSFLLVHIRFTPSEGAQRLCKMIFLRNPTMGVRPSSQTMEKDHLPWSNFMVHGVNRPNSPIHEMIVQPHWESVFGWWVNTWWWELWSGELATSYKWTCWVWEITGWSSRLQENYRSC